VTLQTPLAGLLLARTVSATGFYSLVFFHFGLSLPAWCRSICLGNWVAIDEWTSRYTRRDYRFYW